MSRAGFAEFCLEVAGCEVDGRVVLAMVSARAPVREELAWAERLLSERAVRVISSRTGWPGAAPVPYYRVYRMFRFDDSVDRQALRETLDRWRWVYSADAQVSESRFRRAL